MDKGGAQAACRIGNVPIDNWFHIAVTYGGNKITLFVDGQQLCSKPLVGSLNFEDPVFTLGGYLSNGQRKGMFLGKIDDFRIYDEALSPSEIQGIYNSQR